MLARLLRAYPFNIHRPAHDRCWLPYRADTSVPGGDTSSRVTEAYAGRVTVKPHKYVQGGQYLSVRPASPQDSTRRIVFETENGRVTRFRSGRLPEVDWVERCG